MPAAHHFGVGFYQISQGMKWMGQAGSGSKSGRGPRYESYMASTLHFMVALEKLKAPLERYLPVDLKDLPAGEEGFEIWKNLLFHTASAQQMMCYSATLNFPARAKWRRRYKPKELAKRTAEAIKILMGLIPVPMRIRSVEWAMEEMLPKALWS